MKTKLVARINAVMGAEPRRVPPGPCDGVIQLRFLDQNGEVLAEKTGRVSSTTAEFLEFTPTREAVGRVQVRPQISWVEYPPGPCRGNLIANTEVYDNSTGATQFVIAGAIQ